MIQRKQTLFLIITILLCVASVFVPWSYQAISDALGAVKQEGLTTVNQPSLSVASAAALTLSVFGIFMFKNRGLQKKIIALSIIVIIAWLAVMIYAKFHIGPNCVFYIGTVLPVLAMIMNALAWKGVNADDKLVKSIDRFRD